MRSFDSIFRAYGIGRILIWTISGTVSCTAISLLITYIFIAPFGAEVMRVSLGLAFWIPILLAIPLFSYIGIKLQQLSRANHLLKQANRIDGMTQCLNRTTFTGDVTAIIRAMSAKGSYGTSGLLILDADYFKQINDRFGHLAGDQALISIASVIRSAVRESDLVGRLGGEEFGVFLPETSPALLLEVAESIRRTIANGKTVSEKSDVSLTVSIGGVCFVCPGQYEEVFRAADEQLYLAKSAGRNRVLVVDVSGRADLMVRDLLLATRNLQSGPVATPTAHSGAHSGLAS